MLEEEQLNLDDNPDVYNVLNNSLLDHKIDLMANNDDDLKVSLDDVFISENIIEIENVDYTIEGEDILSDINIYIPQQSCVVILGISGSGKSTLLRLMSGLSNPTRGTVKVMGKDLGKMFHRERLKFINQNIAYVFQEGGLINNLTVYENLVIPLKYHGHKSDKVIKSLVDPILDRFSIGNIKNKYPGKLSYGQKKFVGLARAFLLNPKILFLDEPSSNIDMETTALFLDMIRKYIILGGTVISVTSDMIFANYVASILGILNEGKIIEYGTPSRIKTSENQNTKKVIKNIHKEADLADELLKLMSKGS